ncbi:hypothetical protein BLA29_011160, partial [Euroglyphus maynei]
QRKIIYTCLDKYCQQKIKVTELAGIVSQYTAHQHGNHSLPLTIVNMAQRFKNKINLLLPIGKFGKDAASPRYLSTILSPITRKIFPELDDPLLTYQRDDQEIEPDYYVPIIPMVLVNGSEGIGTGWSTKVPKNDPIKIVDIIKKMIYGEEPVKLIEELNHTSSMVMFDKSGNIKQYNSASEILKEF